MKFSLALFVAGALALATLPQAADAKIQFKRDDGTPDVKEGYSPTTPDTTGTTSPVPSEIKDKCEKMAALGGHNAEFDGPADGPKEPVDVIEKYLKENGAGLPKGKDVRHQFESCRWRGSAWLDHNGVTCYFTPNYKYHAYSPSQYFNYEPAKAACAGEPNRDGYPTDGHIPKYLMSIPSMYMSNSYERRCSVRALVKVPKTDKAPEHWVLAWVVEHNVGTWNTHGLDHSPTAAQQGILLSKDLYTEMLSTNQPDAGTLPFEVEWFFPDLNTL